MKNKELEKQINEMLTVLTDTMTQITSCEMANESLTTEINALKAKIELLENENEQLLERNDDLNDLVKDLRSHIETPKQEAVEVVTFIGDPYKSFPTKTRTILTEMHEVFGKETTDIKISAVKNIIWRNQGINSSICNTLRTMSGRKLSNGQEMVTLTYSLRGGKKQISTFKFNF